MTGNTPAKPKAARKPRAAAKPKAAAKPAEDKTVTSETAVSKAATSDPRRQAVGEGYGPGEAAPSDLYVDNTGKVTKTPPERGKRLAVKGEPVMPWAADVIAEHGFKG